MGRFLNRIVCCISIFLSLSTIEIFTISIAHADSATDTFQFPLKSRKIVRAFVEPETKYSPGHRGVDFYAPKGTSVYSIADGQVIFAGLVAGSLHVTIAHAGGFKSTYTFLATKSLKMGDRVVKGQLVGTTSGGHAPADPDTFLFTLRLNGNYVDPILYLKNKVPIREIHLSEIKYADESDLFDISKNEKQQLMTSIKQIDKIAKVSDGLEAISDSYRETKDALDKLSETSKELAKNGSSIVKEKLNKLEKKTIKQVKKLVSLAKKYGELYLKAYSDALLIGVEAAKLFLSQTLSFPLFMAKLSADLMLGVYDWSLVAVHTSLKMLNQYFDVDWSTLIKEMALPVGCFAGGCTMPIKLACDPSARFKVRTRADGFRGSGNGVMFVAGLNSGGSTKVLDKDNGIGERVGQSVNFPWKTLGYSRNDVSFYSYAGVGKDFKSTEPFQDLHLSASRMDDQIRQWKKDNPNKKLDLITHSLGGSVVALWLAEFYDEKETAYPKLGKVILYAPPLSGTAAATAGKIVDSDVDDGMAFHGDANRLFGDGIIPPSSSKSVNQVAENGELEQILKNSDYESKAEVHVIRTASDFIVTAGSQDNDDVEEIILDTDGTNPFAFAKAHSDLTTDVAPTASAQYILEDKKVPCVSSKTAANSVVKAASVHATEITLSRVARDSADMSDYGGMSSYLNSFAD